MSSPVAVVQPEPFSVVVTPEETVCVVLGASIVVVTSTLSTAAALRVTPSIVALTRFNGAAFVALVARPQVAVAMSLHSHIASTETIVPVFSALMQRILHNSATVTVSPSVVAALAKTAHVSAALTVTPTIHVDTGNAVSAALVVTPSVSPVLHLHPGLVSDSVTVVPVLAVSATRGTHGAVSLTVTPTVVGAISKTVYVTASLTSTPVFTATIAKTVHGAVSLTVTPTVVGAISKTVHVTESLTPTPVFTATIAKTVHGAVSLTVTPTVAVSAAKTIHISASLTVTPTISASATTTSGGGGVTPAAAVTHDATSSLYNGSSAGASFSISNTGTAGAYAIADVFSDRVLFPSSGVTYGGVEMTQTAVSGPCVFTYGGYNFDGYLCRYELADIPGGTQNIVFPAVSGSGWSNAGCVTYTGVRLASTPITVTGNGAVLSSAEVAVPSGGMAVNAFVSDSSGSTGSETIALTNGTQRYNTGGNYSGILACADSAVSITFTATSASNPWAGITTILQS